MTKQGRMVGARKQELVDAVPRRRASRRQTPDGHQSFRTVSLIFLSRAGGLAREVRDLQDDHDQGAQAAPGDGQPITIPAGYRIGFKSPSPGRTA